MTKNQYTKLCGALSSPIFLIFALLNIAPLSQAQEEEETQTALPIWFLWTALENRNANYFCDSASWQQMGADILGEPVTNNDGAWSVGLSDSGLTVAIGARYNDSGGTRSGEARVFQWALNDWTPLGSGVTGATNQTLGWDVALDGVGDTLIAGAPCDYFGCTNGYVRVWDYVNGDWTQRGSDIVGINSGDREGWAVDISRDGNRILSLAERGNGNSITNAGRARVFDWNGSEWQQVGDSIFGPIENSYPRIARLSKDGTKVTVSWNSADLEYINSGRVEVFTLESGNWVALGQDVDGSLQAQFEYVGIAVGLDETGETLALGAQNSAGISGLSVMTFDQENQLWIPKGELIAAPDAQTDSIPMGSEIRVNGRVVGLTTQAGKAAVWQWTGASWEIVGEWIEVGTGKLRDFGMSEDARIIAVPQTSFNSRQGRTRLFRLADCG